MGKTNNGKADVDSGFKKSTKMTNTRKNGAYIQNQRFVK